MARWKRHHTALAAAAGAATAILAGTVIAVNAPETGKQTARDSAPNSSRPSISAPTATMAVPDPQPTHDVSRVVLRFNAALQKTLPGSRLLQPEELRYQTLPDEGLIGGWTAVLEPFAGSGQELSIRINKWSSRPEWSTGSCAVLKETDCLTETGPDGRFHASGVRDVTAEDADASRTRSYREPWARTVTTDGLIIEVSVAPEGSAEQTSRITDSESDGALTLPKVQDLATAEDFQQIPL